MVSGPFDAAGRLGRVVESKHIQPCQKPLSRGPLARLPGCGDDLTQVTSSLPLIVSRSPPRKTPASAPGGLFKASKVRVLVHT
ncbi:hypothetical protein G6O67_002880 [Ophiocordyceps sinensis]|uniref:Uncharacterized protein n=1 Tax=Ophiocordyceps sinensis TaxID=72228 RepID=A0A8H4PV61_9HYPO|nr:hypothetical protein G6O67_002880 [Ophiocordyceps sinensis]